jgi:hypothetical protein
LSVNDQLFLQTCFTKIDAEIFGFRWLVTHI